MYDIAITLYAFILNLISPFYPKVKLMIKGRRKTFDILKKKADIEAKYIWLHAASLGEFEQGRPLIEKIKKEKPNYKILLTFFSSSGYEVRKNYVEADIVVYLPFDRRKNVKLFFDLIPVSTAIFIKYEFWINYLNELNKRKIPTYIISTSFQDRHFFFQWYGKSYRKYLKRYTHLFVQDDHSKELLAQYGIYNVSVCGDTRFDRVYTIYEQKKELPLIEQFVRSKNNVLVAGSTWAADEKLIIRYFNQRDDLYLIIAPHEIHTSHIQAIISQLKRTYVLYSELTENSIKKVDSLIIDCIGLLSSVYRYGKVSYVGGGFGVGIHNVLEAAVYGIPVLFGPNYQQFKEAKKLIDAGGGIVVNTIDEFNSKINELFTNLCLQKTVGEKARKIVLDNRGAVKMISRDLLL